MSSIIRRVPARAMTRQEFLTPFDRFFDDAMSNLFPTFSNDLGQDFFTKGSYPKVNVINYDEEVTIEAAIPGMDKNDVTVEITDKILTISGASNQDSQVEESQYVKREIKKSSFKRSFTLSDNLDSSKISASFDKGILTLSIPKIVPDNFTPETRTIKIS